MQAGTRAGFVLALLILMLPWMPTVQAASPAFRLQPNQGHSGLIQRLAVAPDGRALASAATDGTVRLWSMNGRLLAILPGHVGPVTDVAWHPSGALVASAAEDGQLRLWDADGTLLWARPTEAWGNVYPPLAVTFTEERILVLLRGSLVSFDLDGTLLGQEQVAAAGRSGQILIADDGKVWTTARHSVEVVGAASAVPALPEVFAGEVSRIAQRPQDGAVLAGSDAGCVALLENGNWTLLAACSLDPGRWFPGPERIVEVFFDGGRPGAVSAGGRIEAFGGERAVDLGLSVEIMAMVLLEGAAALALAVGNELLAQDADGEARHFAGSRAHYLTVDVAPSGEFFALGGMEGALEVWRRDGSLAWVAEAHDDSLRALRWHPHLPLLASRSDSELALWHGDGRLLGRLPMQSLGAPFRWDDSAEFVVWASGSVPQGWNLQTGAPLAATSPPDLDEPYPQVRVEGAGQVLALGEDGTLGVTDATGERLLQVLESQRLPRPHSGLIDAIILTDGTYVTLDRAGQIVRWTADGTRRWHRAAYAASSLSAHHLTPDRARRWCAVGARFDADQAAAIEACLSEFDFPAAPEPGVMDSSFWQRAVTPPLLAFWRPERALAEAPEGGRLASGGWDGTISVWDQAGTLLLRHQDHGTAVESISWFPDGRHLLSVAAAGAAVLLDTETGERLQFIASGDDWVVWNEAGLFSASRNAGPLLSIVSGRTAWPVEQFAPRLNDPAALLEPLGLIESEQAAHYRAARARRYARLAGSGDIDPRAAPSAIIRQVERDGDALLIHVRLSADGSLLRRWQVWADQTPVTLDGDGWIDDVNPMLEVTARVPLLDGENRIEVSVTDSTGYESPRAATRIMHTRDEAPALYFAGFGISEYRLPWLSRLFFAHKDALDLAAAFSALESEFSAVRTATWLDDDVSPNAIEEARAFLEQARPEDVVVLFIAGHGTYERDAEGIFYYLLPESEQERLAETAISFEALEGLLYGLPSRRKLFLMDTCESGDLVGERELARYEAAVAAGILPRAIVRPSVAAAPDSEPPARWLRQRDRFIYADLARRSGAIVLSSSMPNETSAEAAYLGNGLFTQGLLNALTDPELDSRGDGWLSVTELFEGAYAFVTRESDLGSGSEQHPVIDRDNVLLDLRLPLIPETERPRFRFGD
ncbi:MAG: caspase family protein [Gammaproteobacteria bacterium]|nr:caspase family protein [Gammaproteobacteria bacterium]